MITDAKLKTEKEWIKASVEQKILSPEMGEIALRIAEEEAQLRSEKKEEK